MTLDDLQGRATIRLWPDCGQLLGLSKNSTYRAASRKEIPGVLTLGRLKVVAVPALLRWLGEENTVTSIDDDNEESTVTPIDDADGSS